MEKDITLELHEKVLIKLFNRDSAITFFDIGACEGLSSVRYNSIFPNSKAYVFEPVPNNYKKIINNIEKFNLKNAQVFELGLSSEKGEATFYVSSGNPKNKEKPLDNSTSFGNKSSSLYKPSKTKEVHPWLEFNEEITIKTDTFKNFCLDQKINTIDFIHMDVQGAELMVLQGAKDMINNINSIWLEVEKIELYENQALKEDIEQFFSDKDFICLLNKVNHIAGDQFWVNKNYFDNLDENTKDYLVKLKNRTQLKSNLSSFVGNAKLSLKQLFSSK
ncbi:FkbM family methyltransferase [Polaribacter porphyrae]|uniref:Methyltransferase FkbM domain-containing protein n=1 Tax=Polaribacter porphyrae TaxID=1137780 RepID=A0A2S7WLZ7_9FLAO|nr:FkbM family methyltransferase [Polaribacter porphyrae]PQJ78486.1 hypothetical protein BTO18_04465 [Polaribacter porphyrae]